MSESKIVNLERFRDEKTLNPLGSVQPAAENTMFPAFERILAEQRIILDKLLNGGLTRSAEHVAQNTQTWIVAGAQLQGRREEVGATRGQVARALNISVGRLKRLESGQAVRDARLLAAAVELYLTIVESKNEEVISVGARRVSETLQPTTVVQR